MGDRQGKEKQKLDKKERMKALNSDAVEINRYLQGKRRFLADAEKLGSSLTGKERLRLYGAGVKNYGFIERAYEIARENPGFMPPHLDVGYLRESLLDFENMSQLVVELRQYLRVAENVALLESDAHYRNALRIYGGLREQARNRVPGAAPLFEALRPFFRRERKREEPAQKKLARDFKRLSHGKADGKIVIEHESPRESSGVREVVDEIHS
jgi:hypothetical protein